MARKKKSEVRMVRVPVQVPGYGHQLTVHGYDLEGTIDEAISALQGLRDQFPEKKLILDWQDVQYEDYKCLHVYEERPETEEEVAARQAKELHRQEQIRKHELAQLESLRKRYPDA